MSYKTTFQIILCLHSYNVITHPHQGLVRFRTQIYKKNASPINPTKAFPYPFPLAQKALVQPTKIYSQQSIEDESCISKAVIVKYSNQVVLLNDYVSFRLQIEAFPLMDTSNIYLEFTLEVARYEQKFQAFETIRLQLYEIETGMMSYCEAQFKQPYLGKICFTLFACMMGYKFEKFIGAPQERAAIDSLEKLLQFYGNGENILPIFYTHYVKKLRHSGYLIQTKVNQYLKKQRTIKYYLPSGQVTEQIFVKYLQNFETEDATVDQLQKQLYEIKHENFLNYKNVMSDFMESNIDLDVMKKEYSKFEVEKYGERVFKSIVAVGETSSNLKENKKISKAMRAKDISLSQYPIQSEDLFLKKDKQEFLFYQVTLSEGKPGRPQEQENTRLCNTHKSMLQYSESKMLIVFCHGFQGSSYDMGIIHRCIKEKLPEAQYLLARCNEEETEGNIEDMGLKLSKQIRTYIKNFFDEDDEERIILNFVGHSMGGIVARASFKHLQKFKFQFGFFCSLSSPHLGYLNGVDGLVKVGLWALRKWKTILSLDQLSMNDKNNPRESFLYKLSKEGSLRWFRKIIFLSSFQDSYVSWHSARVTLHQSKNSRSEIQKEMIHNLIEENIHEASVHRLDVNFNVKNKNLDSFIGRTAHINLIVQQSLFKMINITIPTLFDLREYGKQHMFL